MPDQFAKANVIVGRAGEGPYRRSWWVIPAIVLVAAFFGLIAVLSTLFVCGRDRVGFLGVHSVAVLSTLTKGAAGPSVALGIVAVEGGVYVVDTTNARVLKFRLTGEPVLFWTVSGDGRTSLEKPVDIALDAKGLVYVLDAGSGYVSRFDAQGTPRGRLLGPGTGVFSPQGLAVDGVGNVFVADTGTSRLVRIEASGKVVSIGRKGRDRDGFWEPIGIRIDESGWLYVADSGNGRIKKLDISGHTVAVWRLPGDPAYVALGDHGRIFATSPFSGCVFAVSTVDGVVAMVGGGPTERVVFGQPLGVDVREGRLYVTEGGEVRVYEPGSR
jgi:DNA-binding beta-propeller fold protein YncE